MDTNIFSALLSGDPNSAPEARIALGKAREKGALAACPAVYAELVAGRAPETVDTFFSEKGIEVDWDVGKEVWREAGVRYSEYARTRMRQPDDPGPRRILADAGIFSIYFPELEIISPTK